MSDTQREFGGMAGKAMFAFGVALAAFHIWANTFSTMPELSLSALHFAGFGLLCALTMPAWKGAPVWFDLMIGAGAVACGIYVIFAFDWIYERPGVGFIWSDWLFSILAILIVLELSRRVAGIFIPVMTLAFLSYMTWLGPLVPGVFKFPGLTLETTLFRSYIEVAGMFGPIARISATFVFMFIIFGAFLIRSGAGEFVIDLARAVAGRMVGGPGIVAVLGSALTGTVSGSAVANTVSTGTITIPLMKKAGFPAKFAAGVEASASTGGQLMPPIMGAGAFVMATYTQIPYLTIVAVSVLPAILYFFSVAVWVRIEAKKHGLGGEDEDAPSVGEIMKRGGISFLLPIGVLVAMLMSGYTPTYAAAYAIVSVVVASWFTPNRMGPKAILEALSLGDRLVVLDHGVIQQIGKPNEVFENPANLFVSKLLGYPQVNLIECKAQQSGDNLRLISQDGSITIDVPEKLRQRLASHAADKLIVGVRPMHLHPVTGDASTPGANVCRGVVYVFERLGARGVLTATVGQNKLDVLTPLEVEYQIDEQVSLAIEAENILVFDAKSGQNILFLE